MTTEPFFGAKSCHDFVQGTEAKSIDGERAARDTRTAMTDADGRTADQKSICMQRLRTNSAHPNTRSELLAKDLRR